MAGRSLIDTVSLILQSLSVFVMTRPAHDPGPPKMR
jgi:hypothetical protein